MTNKNIDNPDKLKVWIDGAENKFNLLDNAVSNFNINFNDHKDVNSETFEAADYRLAKYFNAVMRKDTTVIEELHGGAASRNFTKDLGTPQTGDDSGTVSSYMIPTRLYGDSVIRYMNIASEIIPKLRRVTMAGRLVRWPVETAAATLTWVTNEVTAKTETIPTTTYVDLEAETFAGWVAVTDEFMEDSFVDIGGWIRQMVSQDLIDSIEEQALTSSTNPFIGVLAYTSNVDLVIDSTSFDDISWDNLRATKNKLDTARKRQRCSFVMHPTIWDALVSKQDANGKFFYDPARSPVRTAWGYPVLLSDAMPDEDDSASSTPFVMFGPLEQILYGVKLGMEIKYFDQTYYAVVDDENFFRFRTRFGIVGTMQSAFAHTVTAAT